MSDHPVLVTGAAGFIGFCLARRLLDGGASQFAMVPRGYVRLPVPSSAPRRQFPARFMEW